MRPETLRSLQWYIADHVHPGGFLEACLANDLMAATGFADDRSLAEIGEVAHWVYCHCPRDKFGSYEAVRAWIRAREDA